MDNSEIRKLLIIEDDKLQRQSIAAFYEEQNFQVIQAKNGKQGLDQFRLEKPDIVITDLKMPELSGMDVIKILTEESPEIPIIVISGTRDIEDAINAVRHGAWDFLIKPIYDLAILEHITNKAVERAKLIKENKQYQDYLEETVKDRTTEFVKEIKSRIQTEKALQKSEEYLQNIVENVNEIIYTLSLDGIFTFVSPSLNRTLGYDLIDVVGFHYARLIYPDDQPGYDEFFTKIMNGISQDRIEFRIRNKAKRYRWFSSTGVSVKDRNGEPIYFVGIANDITKQKRLQKMREDIERFVHDDLKTPFSAIIMCAKMLLHASLHEVEHEWAFFIHDTGKQMLKTINKSLDLFSMEEGNYLLEPEDFDFVPILTEIDTELNKLQQYKATKLVFKLNDQQLNLNESYTISGKRDYIKDLFSCMIKNALEASPESNQVTVTITQENGFHQFDIHNLGVIPEDTQESFFERYSSTGKKRGTGMGAYSAMLIAQNHYGNITFTTSEENGTHLIITLPITQGSK